MDCQKTKKLIPAYLDGDIETSQLQSFKAHLTICPHCQKELELYEKSWDVLSDWKDIEPKPAYLSRFWSQLSLEKSWYERLREGAEGIYTKRRLAPVLATASFLILISFFIYRHYLSYESSEKILVQMAPEEMEFIQNIELAQNLDVIENIDLIEDMDILENLDSLDS